MNKKLGLAIIILVMIGLGGWWFIKDQPEFKLFSAQSWQESWERNVASEPLRLEHREFVGTVLTADGIIAETNRYRALESLLPLVKSAALRQAAEIKVNDMFARQYFAHNAPTGEGPSDLARQAGYAYITVGENLALGNFKDDAELVLGWMESPGHRANIMNEHYSEIGVFLAQGVYEGERTWIMVQEFGLAASACPAPNPDDEALIERNKIEMDRLEREREVKKRRLDETEPKHGEPYNSYVRDYNATVELFNSYVRQTKTIIDRYNAAAADYNACLQEHGGGS